MNRCPHCGAPGRLTLTLVLAAKPSGRCSRAGAGPKSTAVEGGRLTCGACGWSATGRLEGVQVADDGTITAGHLVTDQPETISGSTVPPPLSGTTRGTPGRRRGQQRIPTYWSAALGRRVTIPDNEDEPR